TRPKTVRRRADGLRAVRSRRLIENRGERTRDFQIIRSRHEPDAAALCPSGGRPLCPTMVNQKRSLAAMNRDLIETYAAGGAPLRQAVQGLSREDLLARPGPGDWSIQELVIHLVDSDDIAIDRMKRILTEVNPPLLYADETAYIARLLPHEQSLEDALTL